MGRCHLLWDLFQLKRNEHKTREQIQALQEKKLRKLLYYAYDHSTYYKEGICVEGLLDYQFRKTDHDAFEMLAQASNRGKRTHIQREIIQQMKKILHEKNMDSVHFFVRFVEEILPDARTGKKQLIMDCVEE